MPVAELSNDDGARLALETSSGALEGGDEGLALREGLDVLDAGLDLGQHGAGGELALCDVLASLGHGHRGELFLVGLVEVDADLRRRSG